MIRSAGLTRRTPLLPGPGYRMTRNVPLRSVPRPQGKNAATGRGGIGQRKAGPPGEFSEKTRLLVRARAGGGDEFNASCECCNAWLGRHGGDYQHRAARGAGGCRDEVVNGPAGGVLLCRPCHARAEAREDDIGMPDEGGRGFWLKHGTTPAYDPRNVPVVLHDGAVVWLAADGKGPDGSGYLCEAPEGIAA
jgi:hypothetical protein